MASRSAARLLAESEPQELLFAPGQPNVVNINPLTILIVTPTLQAGAADLGSIDMVRILARSGNRPIVVSRGGRYENEIADLGVQFIRLDVASKNPFVMLRNAVAIARIARNEKCSIVHAHGRAPAWSAWLACRYTGIPFVTSWYKGFREQNAFKRFYNGIMARGDRIFAASDQIAELINDRYGISWGRIHVVAASVDLTPFDPHAVGNDRVDTMRRMLGVDENTKVILVCGRLLRRKGHHIVVQAARRLRDMGLKDFVCVFAGEDDDRSRYTGELWDLVLSTKTADVVRMAGPVDDMPAAYAVASVVVSAATQVEGVQRAILEAQAMARPVVVSDLGAGPEMVLAPPAVPEDRMTGLRFTSGDDAALAAALIRLFSMPDRTRAAVGARGRDWVTSHFNPSAAAEQTLALYADVVRGHKTA